MFRRAIGVFTAFKSVNRVGLSIGRPRWAAMALPLTRKYASLPPTEVTVKPSLPAIPEASTAPLVDTDFSEYLQPLYEYGWGFGIISSPTLPGVSTLRRNFNFPSTKELAAFIQNTRNVPSNIAVSPKLATVFSLLGSKGKGVTRSVIRLAIETETEYQKICPNGPIPHVRPIQKVTSLEAAQSMERQSHKKKLLPSRSVVPCTPIVAVALPVPPPAPVFPPPSITGVDLETYIKPLITSGWHIRGVPTPPRSGRRDFSQLQGHPSLHRVYAFHDPTPMKDFLLEVVDAIPPPAADSLAGVQMTFSLHESHYRLQVASFSELAEGAPKKYGISHQDVRFAIDIETKFINNWAGLADYTAISSRKVPTTMEEVWNYQAANL
ncbi:hypothetical protein FB451DRAFT_1257885, partial [Mycena latifolia]